MTTEIKSLPIIVPFALGSQHLTPVRIALQHENRHPKCAFMEGDTSYHDLLWKLWDAGEPFILNEHDIISWPGAISKLEECDNPWCTFLYRCEAGWLKRGLGLVKFDPSRLPNIFEEPFGDTHWRCLDTQIAQRLERHGIEVCNHKPAVTNLNPFVWGAAVPHTTESMSYP